jgi:PASTA domain
MRMTGGSDAKAVSGRVFTLPRLTAVGAAVLLVSATISLAADKPTMAKPAKHRVSQKVLRVPDVRGQMFVFASGTLEDGGFGWKVSGGAGGFSSNVVVSQSPKPGTHVIDTGAPAITLHLVRRGAQLGEAQNRSPYGASVIRRWHARGRS